MPVASYLCRLSCHCLAIGLPGHGANNEKAEEEVPTIPVSVANEPQRSGSLSSKLFSGFRSRTKEAAKSEEVQSTYVDCNHGKLYHLNL